MGARSAKVEEFESAVGLINKVFRDLRGEKPTMQQEFPLLLNKDNVENMIVIERDNKIVSDVNYLIQDVTIQGNDIKVASIGGVCTDPEHEGNRYSSTILDYVEDKMLKDCVDVVCISGTRTLYTRRKCSIPKSFYKYTVYPLDLDIDFEVKEYDECHLNKMMEIYNQNSTRFLRTKYEFETLLESSTIPWGTYTYKKLVITIDEEVIGYIVMRVIDEEKLYGKVREMYIEPSYAYQALRYVANKYNLEYVITFVHVKDYVNQLRDYDEKEIAPMDGSLKIINFEAFTDKLRRYFEQYVDGKVINNMDFKKEEDKFVISFGDEKLAIDDIEKLVIDDIDKLNRLFFEGYEVIEEELKELKVIKEFAEKVFPIHFVWSSNLNYQ